MIALRPLRILVGLLALSLRSPPRSGCLGLALDPLYSFAAAVAGDGRHRLGDVQRFLLIAIPLFVMLGEILLRSGHRRAHVRRHARCGCPGCRAG